jgi:hypothetical protein
MPKMEHRWSASEPLKKATTFIEGLDIPVIGKPMLQDPTDPVADVYYPEAIDSMDKSSLERLVWQFSAFKAYLEYQVGILRAKTKAVDSAIEGVMNVEMSALINSYKETNAKVPTKEGLKAEIISNSENMQKKMQIQMETQASLSRTESLYNAYSHLYDGVSRVITVRRDLI